MTVYMIENGTGELILWTANYDRERAIAVFEKLAGQSWKQLEEEGYSVRKVAIKKIVE